MKPDRSSTSNTKIIKATPEKLYQACTDPEALAVWQAPGDMTGKVHHFDLRVGDGYEMSLFYPESAKGSPGKTVAREDRFKTRFTALVPGRKIVQAIHFETDDPSFRGEMTMEITFEAVAEGTKVTFGFKDIPPGIKPEDNVEVTEQSLEKLARYVEQ